MGYLQVFAAVVLWGLNFIIARLVATEVPPAAFAYWRWQIAALLLLPFLPALWRMRDNIRRNWGFHLVAATTGIATYHICVYTGAAQVDIYSMPLLAACSGLFVLLVKVCMREPLSAWQLLGTVLALLGLGVLLGKGNPDPSQIELGVGEVWLLVAAAMWGIYSVVVERRPAGPRFNGHVATIWFALPYLGFVYAVEAEYAGDFAWSWQLGAILAYVAIFPSIICYWLWLAATDRLGAMRTQAVYYTFPLVVAAEAWFILDEQLYAYHGVAAGLIVVGAILLTRRKQVASPAAAAAS